MIRLLIVDDQELIRDGLVTLLNRHADIQVIGTASHGQEAVDMARQHHPDVILMDVRMPIMNGIEATHLIHKEQPTCRIIMLTTFDDEEFIIGALQVGASGYILKNIPSNDLAEAIRMAYRGITQLDPTATSKLLKQMIQSPPPTPLHIQQQIQQLSDRELEVMRLIAQGASNREIAEQLVITEGTVKTHVSNILSQLNLRDRTQIAIFIYQNGLL